MDEDLLADVRSDREKEKERYRKKRKALVKEKRRKKEILSYNYLPDRDKRFGAYYSNGRHIKGTNVSLKYWKKVANKKLRGIRIFEDSVSGKGSLYKRKTDLWETYYW